MLDKIRRWQLEQGDGVFPCDMNKPLWVSAGPFPHAEFSPSDAFAIITGCFDERSLHHRLAGFCRQDPESLSCVSPSERCYPPIAEAYEANKDASLGVCAVVVSRTLRDFPLTDRKGRSAVFREARESR